MPSKVALVTGGGRGIGADVARALSADGWQVAVSARSEAQVVAVAEEIGGLAVTADVAREDDVTRLVDQVESELGPITLLVANAGVAAFEEAAWEMEPSDWWRVLEVNVLGVFLCCRAVVPGMLDRGEGRIVITGSGASYLPGSSATAYSASKAAVGRFGETLARQLADRIPVFTISPGLVKTEMTGGHFSDDAPWTPPELAPKLVVALASGRADRLTGRYIHAEHDDIEDLIRRADEVVEKDLNALRLQR